MSEPKFIISEKQILSSVKYALELNIQERRIVDILMHDIEDEIETVLYDDCTDYCPNCGARMVELQESEE